MQLFGAGSDGRWHRSDCCWLSAPVWLERWLTVQCRELRQEVLQVKELRALCSGRLAEEVRLSGRELGAPDGRELFWAQLLSWSRQPEKLSLLLLSQKPLPALPFLVWSA